MYSIQSAFRVDCTESGTRLSESFVSITEMYSAALDRQGGVDRCTYTQRQRVYERERDRVTGKTEADREYDTI